MCGAVSSGDAVPGGSESSSGICSGSDPAAQGRRGQAGVHASLSCFATEPTCVSFSMYQAQKS